jgi:DNA-binding NarL/FixJ family response regulator
VRILIADDAAVARTILMRMAGEAGFEVAGEAPDAASLLEQYSTTAPDLVIVDGRLPPDGGVDAIVRLRELAPEAAIVVVAAFGETDLLRAAASAGSAGVLLRPFVPSQVAALRRFARTE